MYGQENVYAGAGTITDVACVITTPGGTVTIPGTLATITFIASTTEGTSPLDLNNVMPEPSKDNE